MAGTNRPAGFGSIPESTEYPEEDRPPVQRACPRGAAPVPTSAQSRTLPLVVGIGAAAGAQEALQEFFASIPPGCGHVFVVVMHLPPGDTSVLAEMLRRFTDMDVAIAAEGTTLAPNRIHVIPAGRVPALRTGKLSFTEGVGTPDTDRVVDSWFRELATDAGTRAVAVVLSGFGSDGAEGVKAVRGAGGTVMVQEPDSAVNPAMPRSAAATGAVHFVLPADRMPLKIAEIARNLSSAAPQACRESSPDRPLGALFETVKTASGHDFSSYKRNTVLRRIERRMAVHRVRDMAEYAALLEDNPREIHALCQEILIGVTSFFRDPAAFEAVRREVIPRLCAGRDADLPVRIWHPCCATGEEVYSMAMLIQEYLDEARLSTKVQIFATDIDEAAIEQGRSGLYGDDAVATLGEERLRRFFRRVNNRWQTVERLREMIVFARHNLFGDPPFPRLDLLVCRNFLIYVNTDMQKRLMALFHQVLKPESFLFLGPAETVGSERDLFEPLDKKWRIFVRRESTRRVEMPFPFFTPPRRAATKEKLAATGALPPDVAAVAEKLLAARYLPPYVVVNERYEAIHLSTRAHHYLALPPGKPGSDLLALAREEVRPVLLEAIRQAFAEDRRVVARVAPGVAADGNGSVDVVVEPFTPHPSSERLATVVFQAVSAERAGTPEPSPPEQQANGNDSQAAPRTE